MNLIIDLARGMLSRRRRQTLVSVMGVALGVAFFIAIASLMRGFQTYFIEQVIDVQPHIIVKDETRRPLPQAVEIAHPDAAALRKALAGRLDDARVVIVPGAEKALQASFSTSGGTRRL